MGKLVSFTITKNNNITEKLGIEYILSVDKRFFVPDLESRKEILDLHGLEYNYIRAFDMVMFKEQIGEQEEIEIKNIQDIILVELKVTKKKLPNLPEGFFFGATENEFELAKKLGNLFRFGFISIHEESRSHVLLTLPELEKLIKNKRTQYQVNL